MPTISEYKIAVKFDLSRREFSRLDAQLRALEKRLQAFSKSFGKQFQLPDLVIKNIKLDELKAQRTSQTALNRIGRLLELPVSNFKIDEAKLQRQFQSVFQRAANSARINVKSIAGTGGGGNPYYPHHYQMPGHIQGMMQGGGGFSPSLIGIPRIGAGGLAAGGIGAVGYLGAQQVSKQNETIVQRQAQRMAIGAAVGGSEERRNSYVEGLLDISNRLGVRAQDGIDAYAKFLKQGQAMGRSAQDTYELFWNMSVATRGNGGGQQQIDRQAYALQQILGLGYLRSEELNLQLADSNPTIKKFIMEAYAKRTNFRGSQSQLTEKFMKDMSERRVSVDDVLKGYANSAKEASDRVKELASTLESQRNRTENALWAEEIARSDNNSKSVQSMQELINAQAELQKAMLPLRDVFYQLGAAGTSAAAKLITLGVSKAREGVTRLNAEQQAKGWSWMDYIGRPSYVLPHTSPETSETAKSLMRRFTKPMQMPSASVEVPRIAPMQVPDGILAAANAQQAALDSIRSGNYQNTQNISIGDVVLNVQSAATTGEAFITELRPQLQGFFKESISDMARSTMLNYSVKD